MKLKNLSFAVAALGMVAAPVAASAADSASKLSVAKSVQGVRAPAAAGKSKALAGGGLFALLAAAAVVALVVVVADDSSDSN